MTIEEQEYYRLELEKFKALAKRVKLYLETKIDRAKQFQLADSFLKKHPRKRR